MSRTKGASKVRTGWGSVAWMLAALGLVAVSTCRAGGTAPRLTFDQVRITVLGSVEAVVVDRKSRRTGWYSGRVADSPAGTLEALESEVALPME